MNIPRINGGNGEIYLGRGLLFKALKRDPIQQQQQQQQQDQQPFIIIIIDLSRLYSHHKPKGPRRRTLWSEGREVSSVAKVFLYIIDESMSSKKKERPRDKRAKSRPSMY
jgi:hydrogenase maturation factor HypF (carbamoyltransferase family)